ncbi:MAG: aminotransferase class-V family protein 4 [Gammaproteobacteria bacterium]|nr:aminotransferase class-V family protein 4 [Gammaproteobacteria bacterium]
MNTLLDGEIGGFQLSGLNADSATARAAASLRQEGRSWSEVRTDLIARKTHDYDWRSGRLPLYVYHDNEELLSVSRDAYNLYFSENALGHRAFPSVAGMEEDLIRMSLSLFHAPEEAGGSFTSGGTESLFLALKTARDHFKKTRPLEGKPRIVIPRTAHPAFDKAAQYLEIEVVRTAIGTDLRADAADLLAAIDARTMLIAGSAPCYPYGVFDSIVLLGKIAMAKRIWLHVDACLGGFLAPFARDEGYPIPEFDFSTSGVTSLSADLHKYGFSARGASVVLYRSAELQASQGFHFDNWPRGSYATQTFLGSRPAGSVASAWAVSQYLGRAGYRRLARKTMDAKERLMRGIERIQGLEVVRPSELSIVLYRSNEDGVDIHAVADVLAEKGWFVGRSREPQALHFALNAVHAPAIDPYLVDLQDAVRQVRASGRIGSRDDATY